MTDPELISLVIAATKRANISSDFIATLHPVETSGLKSWKDIAADDKLQLMREKINPRQDAAFIIYTPSDTTGVPKAVLKSHRTSVYEGLSALQSYEIFADLTELWRDSKTVVSSSSNMHAFFFFLNMLG